MITSPTIQMIAIVVYDERRLATPLRNERWQSFSFPELVNIIHQLNVDLNLDLKDIFFGDY